MDRRHSRADPIFEGNHFTEMCCGTEAGAYLRLIDSCITQIKAQGPSRTCHEREEEEEKKLRGYDFTTALRVFLRWTASAAERHETRNTKAAVPMRAHIFRVEG